MKKIYSTAILLFYMMSTYAQGYDDYDYTDEEYIEKYERYARLDLSKGEIISIVVGIVLLLVAKNMTDKNQKFRIGLGCIGFLSAAPLVLVILAIAQKAIGYAVILAIVVGGLYYLFGQKK